MEGEVGVMLPQTKELQEPLEAEKVKDGSSPRAFGWITALPTP